MTVYKLNSEVRLAKNLPELGLIKSDVATVIDRVQRGNKAGYCLEFFDNNGNTILVTIVDEDAIQQPIQHGVVHYREYAH
ncbi:MAG: hypothetical protein BroJett042_17360 [Bacteroidota bacterium]|nr:MAG: hypothetical protein BroJett042_17360 [Bacteroidota bacterium]